MSLISMYGSFSRFSINWDKSVLPPLDPLPGDLPPETALVSVFTSFKCHYYSRVADNLAQNVLVMLPKLHQTGKTWCKLPLSVIGSANPIKMVWMPQISVTQLPLSGPPMPVWDNPTLPSTALCITMSSRFLPIEIQPLFCSQYCGTTSSSKKV